MAAVSERKIFDVEDLGRGDHVGEFLYAAQQLEQLIEDQNETRRHLAVARAAISRIEEMKNRVGPCGKLWKWLKGTCKEHSRMVHSELI